MIGPPWGLPKRPAPAKTGRIAQRLSKFRQYLLKQRAILGDICSTIEQFTYICPENEQGNMTTHRLQERYRKLVGETSTRFHRYLFDRINWNHRMIGLTGPRGVGKTTLVLQHIKEQLPIGQTLYVTAEDFYFADHRLLDLADEWVRQGGKHLVIDEIHRYPDWSKELKLMYDYHPELHVIFTGSSVLDIHKGVADLSRRAVMYHMQGLSFREYLSLFHGLDLPVYSLDEIVQLQVELPVDFHPYAFFPDYLRKGYYPFASEDPSLTIQQIVNITLESDIPQFAGMNISTGRKLKQLLSIIAKSVPFKPNISSIATSLNISRNSVSDYCLYIEEAGLIAQLRDETGGIRGLGKVDKIYLDNTNLCYQLGGAQTDIGNIRETFFFNQMRVNQDVITSKVSDFVLQDYTFEIGGRKKGNKQIEGLPHAFVVKDDIEYAFDHTIPLWQFGFNY